MIAMHPIERAGETQRIETAHFHAGLAEFAPESPRCLAESAHPIVDHAYAEPVARLGFERLGEFSADLVLAENIVLKVNSVFRVADRGKPDRIVFRCILEQTNPISGHERRARRAGESLVQ